MKGNNLTENTHVGKSENAEKEHIRPYSQGFIFWVKCKFIYMYVTITVVNILHTL